MTFLNLNGNIHLKGKTLKDNIIESDSTNIYGKSRGIKSNNKIKLKDYVTKLIENDLLVWDWNLDTKDWKATTDEQAVLLQNIFQKLNYNQTANCKCKQFTY